MKCSNCGEKISMDGKVCKFCGFDKTENVKKEKRKNRIIGVCIFLILILFINYIVFIDRNPLLILILKKLGLNL